MRHTCDACNGLRYVTIDGCCAPCPDCVQPVRVWPAILLTLVAVLCVFGFGIYALLWEK